MNKNKFYIIFLLSILFLSFQNINVSAMYLDPQPPIEQFLNELKQIEGEYYLLGKSAIKDSYAGRDTSQLKKDINFYIEDIVELESRMNDYLPSIENDKIKSRNVMSLIFIANYYKIGLEELLILIDSDDDTVDFNSLESYFYSKVLASQTINFLEDQLK